VCFEPATVNQWIVNLAVLAVFFVYIARPARIPDDETVLISGM